MSKGSNFFSSPSKQDACPKCKGTGKWYKPKDPIKMKVTCNRCSDGWVSVACRNCVKGITADGKPCKTCGIKKHGVSFRPGTYVYRPVDNEYHSYPGKVCKYCHGKGNITKIDKVKADVIDCRLCSGTGKIAATNRIQFNPLIGEDALTNILNMMAGINEKEISSIDNIPVSDVPEVFTVGHVPILRVNVFPNGIVDNVKRL